MNAKGCLLQNDEVEEFEDLEPLESLEPLEDEIPDLSPPKSIVETDLGIYIEFD